MPGPLKRLSHDRHKGTCCCWSGSYNILMQESAGASDKSSHTSTSKTWHLQARSSCKDLLVRISREGLHQDPHKIFWQGPAQDHAEHFQKLSARPWREDVDRRWTCTSHAGTPRGLIFSEGPDDPHKIFSQGLALYKISKVPLGVFRRISVIFFKVPKDFRIKNYARSCKEPAQSGCTWTSHKRDLTRQFAGKKFRAPDLSRTFCATLHNQNAHGNVTTTYFMRKLLR